MELPKDVSVKTTWEGQVELRLLQGGVNDTFHLDPNDAYSIGLALVEMSYEATKKVRQPDVESEVCVSNLRSG